MAKIVSVKYWTHDDAEFELMQGFIVPAVPDQHFRGFEITYETTSGTQVETYGETSVLATNEYSGSISFEIMHFAMNVDAYDIEGFSFMDYA